MEPLSRLRLDVAYDGTCFHGWAEQPGLRTVEGELTEALRLVLRQPLKLTVAGRTDAGVHARSQVAHVDVVASDLAKVGSLESLRLRVQGLLVRSFARLSGQRERTGWSDLVLREITVVDQSFDARFSAMRRHYCYRLADAQASLDPLARTNVWWNPGATVDVEAMNESGKALLGDHDFLSFCRPRVGATTIRTLREASVSRHGNDGPVELAFSADAFCHSMVRSLVGALVEVGRGKRDREWIRGLLERPARDHGVPVAPACGLTLEGVDYPPSHIWEQRAKEARQRRCLEC